MSGITATLSVLIAKAYRMAHKRVPEDTELVLEASNLANSLVCIPESKIVQCYEYARVHYHDLPTARMVMKAWDNEIRKEGNRLPPPEEMKLITNQKRPDEHWRDLVAARMLGSLPNMSAWLKSQLALSPSRIEKETFCRMVREEMAKTPDLIEHIGQKNPYGITADQIRTGLPASETHTSPIYQREEYDA